MKRSLEGGSRGGGMLRSVGAGFGGAHGAFSSAKPKPADFLSVSSASSSSSLTLPVPSASGVGSACRGSSSSCDSDDLVIYQDEERQVAGGFFERFVFSHPPSRVEVEDAVSAIQRVVLPFSHEPRIEDRRSSRRNRDSSYPRPEPDWIEPTLQIRNNSTRTQFDGYSSVMQAFHLLRVNPSVQRMVVSLSSDKAIWDAVMKNEVVREMKETLCGVCSSANESPSGSDENPAARILKYILEVAKVMVVEFIERTRKQVNDLFVAPSEEDKDEKTHFADTLKSSFVLSIMVLLVVLVTRSQRN